MLYGREPVNPADIDIIPPDFKSRNLYSHIEQTVKKLQTAYTIAKAKLEEHQEFMKKCTDRTATKVNYSVGQQVYLHVPATKLKHSPKLTHFWRGPFVITAKLSPVNFKLKWLYSNKSLKNPVHANRLKLATTRHIPPDNDQKPLSQDPPPDLTREELLAIEEQDNPTPIPSDNTVVRKRKRPQTSKLDPTVHSRLHKKTITKKKQSPDGFYQIEKIMGKRKTAQGQLEYLIKWKGFAAKFNSWEPDSNLNTAARAFIKTNDILDI